MIEKIVWSKEFKRAFRKRVLGKLHEKRFEERIRLFAADPFDARLNTHKLSGTLQRLWSFSITFDCRVVFKFLPKEQVLLIDIGTHDEVY